MKEFGFLEAPFDKKKQERTDAVAKLRLRQVPGLSICQSHKVAASTAEDYREAFHEMVVFSETMAEDPWGSVAGVDSMLVDLFDDKMLDGVHSAWAGKAFSALGYFIPALSRGAGSRFPAALAAQQAMAAAAPKCTQGENKVDLTHQRW